eukprot:CAMPEP_0118979028 /NCGR_PEP_ID=MMETSP1173-20130426/25020_1 /TAXON_ID=1034831 /ORGANISM="Rhizochromulina marina cf, Strain CCMP1243" /LENGTH=59 /DNA_ID=CAMNT_0006929269 /DNA_START=39 /DNA_END=215 /DNA_ORIENTATION=-
MLRRVVEPEKVAQKHDEAPEHEQHDQLDARHLLPSLLQRLKVQALTASKLARSPFNEYR